MKRILWPLLGIAVLVLCHPVMASEPVRQSGSNVLASETLALVTGYWQYEYDSDSSYPHRIYIAAEIRNDNSKYIKNVAVRIALRSSSGNVLLTETGSAWQAALAPGESTLFTDTIYDDAAFLTASVELLAFGDASSQAEYPYLPDPEPLYVETEIEGGYVTYYGEFLNQTSSVWQAGCKYCDAVDLGAAYYEDGRLVSYGVGGRPEGHLPPGSKLAFRFSFERVPNDSYKLFRRVSPLPLGSYATSWAVENIAWQLRDTGYGSREIHITARIVNTSNVAAQPDIWFIAYNQQARWLGWTSAFVFDPIPPGGYLDSEEDLSEYYMHVGRLEDVVAIVAFVASSDVSHVPTPVPTATFTPMPTLTPTPSPTNTRFPTPPGGWPYSVELPILIR